MNSQVDTIQYPRCDVVSLMVPMSEWIEQSHTRATIYCYASCKDPVFYDTPHYGTHSIYPLSKPPVIKKAISPQVAEDFKEALLCRTVGAPRATVAMCRRALQSSAIEKGANGDKLIDQIGDLHKQGKITQDLKDWSHEIRLTGNVGAHPDKDGLKDVTPDDAEQI